MTTLREFWLFLLFSAGAGALGLLPWGPAGAQLEDPASLQGVATPAPMDVSNFATPLALTTTIVKDQAALVRLGKALFWDMQAGSDGVTACASCHFQAGADMRVAVNGSFKASSLRNLALTGPYFHHGGDLTLRQTVEFYVRGGNFPATNFADFDFEIAGIPAMALVNPDGTQKSAVDQAAAEGHIDALEAFLANGLLDPRAARVEPAERGPTCMLFSS